jgi:hypothetical protein
MMGWLSIPATPTLIWSRSGVPPLTSATLRLPPGPVTPSRRTRAVERRGHPGPGRTGSGRPEARLRSVWPVRVRGMHRWCWRQWVLVRNHGGSVPPAGQEPEHQQPCQCQRGHDEGTQRGHAYCPGWAGVLGRPAAPCWAGIRFGLKDAEVRPGAVPRQGCCGAGEVGRARGDATAGRLHGPPAILTVCQGAWTNRRARNRRGHHNPPLSGIGCMPVMVSEAWLTALIHLVAHQQSRQGGHMRDLGRLAATSRIWTIMSGVFLIAPWKPESRLYRPGAGQAEPNFSRAVAGGPNIRPGARVHY